MWLRRVDPSLTAVQAYTRRVRSLLFAVAVVLVFGAATASSAPSGACSAGTLRGTFAAIPNSMGLGNISYRLRIQNRSSSACSFPRQPAAQLYGFRHRRTPTHAAFQGVQGSIVLPAGRTLVSDARFSPDVPSQGEPLRKACERVSHWLRVGPVTVPVKPPTRVCGFGAMLFSPLHVR